MSGVKIKLLRSVTHKNVDYVAGQTLDLTPEQAAKFMARGLGTKVLEPSKPLFEWTTPPKSGDSK